MERDPQLGARASDDGYGGAAERERQINEALDLAWQTGRPIDDLTAKRIARAIDPGQGALRVFAETGAITDEMESELEIACEAAPELKETWIAALDHYCSHRLIRAEILQWNDDGMV